MRTLPTIGVVAGLAVIGLLVAWQGAARVADILGSVGWGIALLPLVWLLHLMASAASWRLLFGSGKGPRFIEAARALWMGHSVSTLLPVAGVGEEVVKVRVLTQADVSGVDASAAVVLDKTVQALSLLAWGLVGAGLLAGIHGGTDLAIAALIGSALLATGIAGFIAVQHAGPFGFLAQRLGRLPGFRNWSHLAHRAGEVDAIILELYRRRGRLALACALRLGARVVMTAEIVLVAYLMGHPVSLVDAIILRSLTTALRGATFVVPNGLGIQEGGFVALGVVAGLPPEFMLALSLATRGRELLVSVPGLIAWQHAEGRTLFKRLSGGRRRVSREPGR